MHDIFDEIQIEELGKQGSNIDYIFHPRSVAVIGASSQPGKQGYEYLKLLLEFGFKGKIFAVNPKGGKILEVPAYPSLASLPVPEIDYVISAIPNTGLSQLLEDCLSKKVKVLQLYTARLGETGKEELIHLEKEIVRKARTHGMRLLGPNCMGIYYPKGGLSFLANFPKEAGSVGFITQSAAHAGEVVYRASLRGVRFSKVISYGNASDLNETDFIHYFSLDPETKIIAAYIEGVRGDHFFETLKKAARAKPVIIYKGGRTEAGRKAAASHTGSMAGPIAIWQGLAQQSGIILVDNIDELIDLIVAFSFMPSPKGRRVGILGAGGGGSVSAADECTDAGLEIPPLPTEIIVKLQSLIPEEWDLVGNPVDVSVVVTGKAGPEVLYPIIKLLCQSPEFHSVILDALEWRLASPRGEREVYDLVTTMIEANKVARKPIAVIFRPGDSPEEWRWRLSMQEQQRCISSGLAIFPTISRAAKALGKFTDYHLRQKKR